MKKQVLFLLLSFAIISIPGSILAQSNKVFPSGLPGAGKKWVDSVYNSMTLEECIGQLIMIKASSRESQAMDSRIEDEIKNYKVGGICFFKGTPLGQAMLTNDLQAASRIPLLVSMDAEWGLGMRLTNAMSFPRQMTLGAISDTGFVRLAADRMAKQLRRLGVNISFSPVADINSNPANPIINIRSFGENKYEVADKSLIVMEELQDNGIMAVAKHFPGHGDTDIDSHRSLPVITHNKKTLDTLDLFPFKALIRDGIYGIMAGHISLPVYDSVSGLPASLSKNIIHDLLRNKMGFKGLVFTDALDMRSVSTFAAPGKLEVMALMAGNDILLFPENLDVAIREIKTAVDSNLIPRTVIEEKCKRVLAFKYKLGLSTTPVVKLENLETDLSSPSDDYLIRTMYESAITVVKNTDDLIPVKDVEKTKMASLLIGNLKPTIYEERLSSYAPVDHYFLPQKPAPRAIEQMLATLKSYDLIFVALSSTNTLPGRNFGIEPEVVNMIDNLGTNKKVVLNLFTVPYALDMFKNTGKINSIIVAYQDNPLTYDLSAQVIFGAIGAKGRLPVTASQAFPLHTGLFTGTLPRFKFTQPEEVGMSSYNFVKIDSLIQDGVNKQGYPGAQVLIAVKGDVIYQKSFGFHDDTKKLPVTNYDIFDLASVTKTSATTPSVMKLYEEGLIKLDNPLSDYYTRLKNSNKSDVTVREVMTHQAGFTSFIPFYQTALKINKQDSSIFHKVYSEAYPLKVADQMWERRDYPEIMLDTAIKSPVSAVKTYKYSDLSMILMAKAIEQVSGKPVDEFVADNIYKPLGLTNIGYNPWKRFPLSRIIPTENDTIFRKQMILGTAHDEGAAMFGGVAGHAGLFSNAGDLAVYYQMLLNGGVYGSTRLLDSSTVKLFTSYQYAGSTRALGFDKPQLDRSQRGMACPDASSLSFNHTGFTGTYFWADPKYDLLIVFLTNHVNPTRNNNILSRGGYRYKLQQMMYDFILRPPVPVPVYLKPLSEMKNKVVRPAVVHKATLKHHKHAVKHKKTIHKKPIKRHTKKPKK